MGVEGVGQLITVTTVAVVGVTELREKGGEGEDRGTGEEVRRRGKRRRGRELLRV